MWGCELAEDQTDLNGRNWKHDSFPCLSYSSLEAQRDDDQLSSVAQLSILYPSCSRVNQRCLPSGQDKNYSSCPQQSQMILLLRVLLEQFMIQSEISLLEMWFKVIDLLFLNALAVNLLKPLLTAIISTAPWHRERNSHLTEECPLLCTTGIRLFVRVILRNKVCSFHLLLRVPVAPEEQRRGCVGCCL